MRKCLFLVFLLVGLTIGSPVTNWLLMYADMKVAEWQHTKDLARFNVPVRSASAQNVPPPSAWRVNLKGSPGGTAITVSSTAVEVMGTNNTRTYAIIKNTSANSVSCMARIQGTPTATAGKILAGDDYLKLTSDSVDAVYCIRTGGSDGTLEVLESIR